MGPISGQINFGGGSIQNPLAAYQTALQTSRQQYQNVMAGYQNVMQAQQDRANQISQGYGQLSKDVLGQIDLTEAPQRQAIAEQYARAQGDTMQSATDRGLGNLTVADSLQRGVMADRTKADISLTGELAGKRASALGDIGLAGLGYQGQSLRDTTGIAQSQLGFMGGYQAPDPLNYSTAYQHFLQGPQERNLSGPGILSGRYLVNPQSMSRLYLGNG